MWIVRHLYESQFSGASDLILRNDRNPVGPPHLTCIGLTIFRPFNLSVYRALRLLIDFPKIPEDSVLPCLRWPPASLGSQASPDKIINPFYCISQSKATPGFPEIASRCYQWLLRRLCTRRAVLNIHVDHNSRRMDHIHRRKGGYIEIHRHVVGLTIATRVLGARENVSWRQLRCPRANLFPASIHSHH